MTTRPGSGEEQVVELSPRLAGRRSLSHTQRQIWTAQRLHPDRPLSNMGKRHRITGALSAGQFVRAFDEVVRATEILRSTIEHDRREGAVRRVHTEPPRLTEIVSLAADDLEEWCVERIAHPLDATRCAYDSVLLRHSDTDWTWWLDLHHVVTDAWSSALVFRSTATAYGALSGHATDDGGFDPAILELVPFDEHVADLRRRTDPSTASERSQQWSEESESFGAEPPLTPYGPRGPRTTEAARLSVGSDELAVRLRAALDDDAYRALSPELSLLGLLISTLAVTINRLDGRDALSFGVPIHHRSGPHARHVIGPLMELYPLRVRIERDDTFATLVARVRAGIVGLLRRARPEESPPHDFEVVVNVLNSTYGNFDGLETTTEWMRSGHVEPSNVVRLQAYDYSDEIKLELDLNNSLSADGAHRSMPAHLEAVLRAALARPATAVSDVELVSSEDRSRLLSLNQPRPHHATAIDRPIHEVVRDRLRNRPEWIVAEHDDREMTAAELDRRAEASRAELVRLGVRPGDSVALCMRRSLDLIVAIHGVLRAGAAFVMLDPTHPVAHNELKSTDAGVRLLLDRAPDTGRVAAPAEMLTSPVSLDEIAYVLYTSGSTGAPKGVPISHRGLSDYLGFALDTYVDARVVEPLYMPLHTRVTFDLTITSLFLPLLADGRIVVVDDDGVDGLARIAGDDRLNALKATPSQIELLVRMLPGRSQLRTVVVGGEAFRRPTAAALAALCTPDVAIFNEYGPTEAVVGCVIHRWDPESDLGADVPIGRSCPGAEVFVLDGHGKRTVPGAWGELYVRRPGMATGYLHQPELTASSFVRVDGITDELLYRTGDRVRLEPSDVLVYGGRLDDQLDVNGIRLEPGEVEAALVSHADVDNAVVRVWERLAEPQRRCRRCGLGDDVPGIVIDDDDCCSTCRKFDLVAPQTMDWFRTPDDLDTRRDAARAARSGPADCIHLLSGGKDSTYALYQLVERGWEVHALTLDNGFISPEAIANIERTVEDLGISHEFVRTDAMNEIFRDSLERFSNVCNGCFKTLYTLAVSRARDLGIPTIVTGLSRGQFFETRLTPHQFEPGRFDPRAVDATVLEARRAYHQTDDAVTALLPEQQVFDDVNTLDEIEFVDFYRFVDVALDEMYEFLEKRAPWVRPKDTGRSTNCIINDLGIWVHRHERGYHNYAEPYAWDVRLGHKTRSGALEELDDDLDEAAIHTMMSTVGYEPRASSVLTAWYQTTLDHDIDPDLLRRHLRERLPDHAIPSAFVRVQEIPLATSAKVDVEALPAPTRFRHPGGTGSLPTSRLEKQLAAIWSDLLGVEHIGIDDDFFDLGGASLAALEAVAMIEEKLGLQLEDAVVFHHRTIGQLAAEIGTMLGRGPMTGPGVLSAVTRGRSTRISPRPDTPLSAGQRGLLYEYRTDPTTSRYGVTRRYRFTDPVDAGRLKSALTAVVARHDTLRTTFTSQRRELPVADALHWTVVDRAELTDGVDQLAARLAAEPFDVDDGPFVKATLVEGTDAELILSLHHLWCDAGSLDILWRDLGHHYQNGVLPARPLRYSDHAAWQADGVTIDDEEFWIDLLAEIPSSPELDLVRPSLPEPDGYVRRSVVLQTDTQQNGTLFPTFLAAVDVVLSAMTDDPVLVGVPVTLRDVAEAHEVVGYFLNTLAIPLPPLSNRSFADLRAATESLLAEVIPHRTVPYSAVTGARRRSGSSGDLARVMVVHDPRPASAFAGIDAASETIFNGTAVTDLSLLVTETPGGCVIAAEWSGERFQSVDVALLLDRLIDVVVAGLESPARASRELVERAPDLAGPDLRNDGTVLDLFQRQVRLAPAATAVSQGGDSLTYAELESSAAQIAETLRHRGVTDGDRVALVLQPSVHQVAAILGVLLAGGAYVPVDPMYPAERVDRLLSGSDPKVVLRDSDRRAMLTDRPGEKRLPLPSVSPEHPAYVIFTSATTGVPKGVQVRHRHLAASNGARLDRYEHSPARFLWISSFGFDSSMVGLFWTLTTGGELIIPDAGRNTDIDHLLELIEERSVTDLLTVPTIWAAMLRRVATTNPLSSLTAVIVAGETVTGSTVEEHHRVVPHAALWNEYGPTEATVWATVHRCVPGQDPVPIGRPIPGAVTRVAGADGRPRPSGVAGELWIGGAGVTDGYFDDDESASHQFVEAETPVRRWYRTGDRVILPPSGDLEFLGRRDGQLNVAGVRIEPAEIEEQLCRWEGIREACVVEASDRPVLVAHVEADEIDSVALRGWLAERLPASHVPARFASHRTLPRTRHGKLDRGAVQRLSDGAPDLPPTPVLPAGYSTTELVVDAWRQVLGTTRVSVETDYFDAGGDSLAAVEIVMSVAERTGREVPISALLTGRTPAGMAALLEAEAQSAGVDDRRVHRVVLRHGEPGGAHLIVVSKQGRLHADRRLAGSFPDDYRVVALVLRSSVGEDSREMVELARECLDLADLADEEGFAPPVAVIGRGPASPVAHALACTLDLLGRSPRGLLLIDPISEFAAIGRAEVQQHSSGNTGGLSSRVARRVAKSAASTLVRWGAASATQIPSRAADSPTILYCSPEADRQRIKRTWRPLAPDLRVVPTSVDQPAEIDRQLVVDIRDLIDRD